MSGGGSTGDDANRAGADSSGGGSDAGSGANRAGTGGAGDREAGGASTGETPIDRRYVPDRWAYENIVAAVPGVTVPARIAIALQVVGFEAAVLLLWAVYGFDAAAVAGTVAVALAGVGSLAMVRIARRVRASDASSRYRRLLLGSDVEVALGVIAYAILLTYLFILDPRTPAHVLIVDLLGERPPALAVFLGLVLAWDLCYRIGAAWWASVVALWRSVRCDPAPATARTLLVADRDTLAFGVAQLVLVPLVWDHPLLVAVVVGHVAAVVAVTTLAVGLLRRRARRAASR